MGFFSSLGNALGFGNYGGSNDTKAEYQWYDKDLERYDKRLRETVKQGYWESAGLSNLMGRTEGRHFEGFQNEIDSMRSRGGDIRGAYAGLEDSILAQGEASSAASSVGAMQAARFAGGGRGGLGFGGGAGAIAAQNAQTASMSAQQNLLNSLVGAKQVAVQGATAAAEMDTQMDQYKNQMGFNLRQVQNQDQIARYQMMSDLLNQRHNRALQAEGQIHGGRQQMATAAFQTAMEGERQTGANRASITGSLFGGLL